MLLIIFLFQLAGTNTCITDKILTRDAYSVAKIRNTGFRKVFNVWTKSHFSNFEVGQRTLPWSRKCLSWVFKQIQTITGCPSKLRNRVFSWKMCKMSFKFSKLIKSIVFRCLRTNKTVDC